MNFDFPLATEIIGGVNAATAAGIAAKLVEIGTLYPRGAVDAPFLTNHDNVRLATQLGGNLARMKNAASILLTVPGAPFLYYGEEVGLANGTTSNDEAKRTPMPWDSSTGGGFTTATPWFPFAPGKETANVASQTDHADSLLSRYRALIRLRRSSAALSRGDIEIVTPASGSTAVLAFLRTEGDERVLVAHNVTDSVAVAGPLSFPGASAEKLFADPGVGDLSGSSGTWNVALPPRSSAVFRIR